MKTIPRTFVKASRFKISSFASFTSHANMQLTFHFPSRTIGSLQLQGETFKVKVGLVGNDHNEN